MKFTTTAVALAALLCAGTAFAAPPSVSVTNTSVTESFTYTFSGSGYGVYSVPVSLASGYTYDLVFHLESSFVSSDGGGTPTNGFNPGGVSFPGASSPSFTSNQVLDLGGGSYLYTDRATFLASNLGPGTYPLVFTGTAANGGKLLGDVTVTRATAIPAVPEPETYAMMLAGLGAIGFMARRRKAA